MGARRIDGHAVNGERQRLADVIPLAAPYAIAVFPIYACNFKCSYCIHSIPHKDRPRIVDKIAMDLGLYKKIIDDLCEFSLSARRTEEAEYSPSSEVLRALHFAGLGEPLMHPDIVEMVRYAKEKGVARVVDIVSNGALLTEEKIDGLVKAGLDRIRISLQGLDAGMYKDMSDVDIDFAQFRENLRYFYEHRGDTKIYIKIMDVSLKERGEAEFLELFSDLADDIAIEKLCPLVDDIDYEDDFAQDQFIYTMNGNPVKNAEVCPQPFYTMQINPAGECIPCCTIERPLAVGNCAEQSLKEIWNGSALQAFRRKQLEKKKNEFPVCRQCVQYKYGMFPEDILDDDAETILKECFR